MKLYSAASVTAICILPIADLTSNLPFLWAWFSPERVGWLVAVLGGALIGSGLRLAKPRPARLDKDAIKRIFRAARAAHIVQGGRRSSTSRAA